MDEETGKDGVLEYEAMHSTKENAYQLDHQMEMHKVTCLEDEEGEMWLHFDNEEALVSAR